MGKSLKSLRERAKEFSILLPFMENRKKGELNRLHNDTFTINEYGFLIDPEKQSEYVCFTVKEDPQSFYFGGQVLTENMQELEAEGYHEAIVKEGIPVRFSSKKSKNKRDYTTVEFFPEDK